MPLGWRARERLRAAALLVAGTYVLVIGALWATQTKMIFPVPVGELEEINTIGFADFGLVRTVAADGTVLHFYAAPARPNMPTVIMFHGNGSRSDFAARYLKFIQQAGYGLVLAEYRGYGGNPGTPSEAGLLRDARAQADWAQAHGEVGPPILLGESIGSGVALDLAAERKVRALILDSPFTSLVDVMHRGLFWAVPGFLVGSPFFNLEKAPGIKVPVLVLSGQADGLTPPAQAARLTAAFPAARPLVSVPGVGHLVLANDRSKRADAAVLAFLGSLAP